MATKKPSIERIYHPYWEWEEIAANMWGVVDDRNDYLQRAIELTGDHEAYGSLMIDAVDNWEKSCEHNLSNKTQNRRAWIGHAACAFGFNCPEDIVREAWSHLTKDQQRLANEAADKAIAIWEFENA